MSFHSNRLALVFAGLVVILSVAILSNRSAPVPIANAIQMRFLGYTNPPSNFGHFAVFSASNLAGYCIAWRGDWVEVEGSHEQKAKIINPNLPGYKMNPLLGAGESVKLAVGQPFYAPETGSWRYCTSFLPQSRSTIGRIRNIRKNTRSISTAGTIYRDNLFLQDHLIYGRTMAAN